MARSMNIKRHWPTGPLTCWCGDAFDTQGEAAKHARTFIGGWKTGPRWHPVGEGRQARFGLGEGGHQLSWYPGLSIVPVGGKITCTCGWTRRSLGQPRLQEIGRTHLITVVYDIIGLENGQLI